MANFSTTPPDRSSYAAPRSTHPTDRRSSRPPGVFQGIWHIETPLLLFGIDVGLCTTVVQLPKRHLWVHAPGPLDDGLRRKLLVLGEVRYLVAPNLFHHRHLHTWQSAFPGAVTYGPAALMHILESKGQKRGGEAVGKVDHALPTETSNASTSLPWAPHILQDNLGGMPRFSETVFFHAESKTMIATDLMFNVQRDQAGPWTRFKAKLFGLETGPRTSRLFRSMVRDRVALGRSLHRMLLWEPEHISVAHGSRIEQDAQETLRRVFAPYLAHRSSSTGTTT